MKVKISEIQKLLTSAAEKYISLDEASYFTQEYIECALRMYPDINPIEEAVSNIENWRSLPKIKPEVLVDKPGTLLINFNKLAPSLWLKHIHDELEKRAKENGIAICGINNSNVTSWLKLWTLGLAKRGLIALYMFNGGAEAVVPYGGTNPIFGTNPFSYAIPTDDEPILVDMATGELPFYKYNRARKSNKLFKGNAFVDKSGNLTNDPQKAFINEEAARILPMGGGYKGYNVVLLVEILTGALVRSKMGTEKSSGYNNNEYGGLLIAIDVAGLTDLVTFKRSVSQMSQDIRNQKPSNWAKGVFVPGDISKQRAKKLHEEGILEISDEVFNKLKGLIAN